MLINDTNGPIPAICYCHGFPFGNTELVSAHRAHAVYSEVEYSLTVRRRNRLQSGSGRFYSLFHRSSGTSQATVFAGMYLWSQFAGGLQFNVVFVHFVVSKTD
jgi:hypothetical protein